MPHAPQPDLKTQIVNAGIIVMTVLVILKLVITEIQEVFALLGQFPGHG